MRMQVQIIWLLLYVAMEFINRTCAYQVLFHAAITQKKIRIVGSFILVCILQAWLWICVDQTMVDIVNTLTGLIIPLLWLKGRKLQFIIYYPIVRLGTAIVDTCVSYMIAIGFNISQEELSKSPALTLLSMSSAVILMILYALWRKRKKKEYVNLELTGKQYFIILLGLICCVSIIGFIQWMMDGRNISQGLKDYIGLSISIISTVIVLASIWIGIGEVRQNEYQHQVAEYERYLLLQEERIQLLVKKDTQLRKFRHDMHAHMTALMVYAKKSSDEELKAYIEEMNQDFTLYSVRSYTGNHVIDAVIQELFYEAENRHILMEWSGSLSDYKSVSVYDFCTIFSNLISNAIEACEKLNGQEERRVMVSVLNYQDNLYLRIRNTCLEGAKVGKKQILATTKQDELNHGFGMKNVRETVMKYDGKLSFKCTEGWFEVQVLL